MPLEGTLFRESGRDLTPNIGVYARCKIPPTLEEYA